MPKTSLQYTHDFTGAEPEKIYIEIIGDSPDEALHALMEVTDGLNISNVPWKARVTLSDIAKPVTKAEVKKDPSLSSKYDLDEALKILTKTYSDARTRDETKSLLKKYEITKFGDVPIERAKELHSDAVLIFTKLK